MVFEAALLEVVAGVLEVFGGAESDGEANTEIIGGSVVMAIGLFGLIPGLNEVLVGFLFFDFFNSGGRGVALSEQVGGFIEFELRGRL